MRAALLHPSIASWDPTLCRYILVDNVAGNDASDAHFIDAALGSTLTLTGITPLKTWTKAKQMLPVDGAGRSFAVLFKNNQTGGTSYLKPDGVTAEEFDPRLYVGYNAFFFAGSTDLTNSATDQILSGAMIASTGPNGDGSWTVAGGATTSVIPISAGTLPAESPLSSSILMYRIRFKGNMTSALANICKGITTNTSGGLTVAENLSVAPASGDEFFIERCGVVFNRVQVKLDSETSVTGTGSSATNRGCGLRGLAALSDFQVFGSAARVNVGFCEARGGRLDFIGADTVLNINSSHRNEAGTNRAVGFGLRTLSTVNLFTMSGGQLTAFVCGFLAADAFVSRTNFSFGTCVFGRGFFEDFCTTGVKNAAFLPTTVSANQLGAVSTSGTFRQSRFLGTPEQVGAGVVNINSGVYLRGADFANAGANPLIKINGIGCKVSIDDVTGTTGNTSVGLDLSTAYDAEIVSGVSVANSAAGTGGEIQYAGPALGTWAGLTQTNVKDKQGNKVQGSAGVICDQCEFVINKTGVTGAIGDVVKSNGTTIQVTSAQANTAGVEDTHVAGTWVTTPAVDANGYIAQGHNVLADFDGAPTVGACAYLSPGTARKLTTTIPAIGGNNKKLRVGRVIQTISGNLARATWFPENMSVPADNLP